MKSWHRYAITLVGGLAAGLGGAWALTNGGLGDGGIRNGPWTTSLGYGTKATDPLTRAMVARSGLLALPAKETVYWLAKTDASGAALDGNCRYRLSASRSTRAGGVSPSMMPRAIWSTIRAGSGRSTAPMSR